MHVSGVFVHVVSKEISISSSVLSMLLLIPLRGRSDLAAAPATLELAFSR